MMSEGEDRRGRGWKSARRNIVVFFFFTLFQVGRSFIKNPRRSNAGELTFCSLVSWPVGVPRETGSPPTPKYITVWSTQSISQYIYASDLWFLTLQTFYGNSTGLSYGPVWLVNIENAQLRSTWDAFAASQHASWIPNRAISRFLIIDNGPANLSFDSHQWLTVFVQRG